MVVEQRKQLISLFSLYLQLIPACKIYFPKIEKSFELKWVWCPLLNCRRFLSWVLSAYLNCYVTFTCCTKQNQKWPRHQKLTCRFQLSMGHFCRAAGNILIQHNTHEGVNLNNIFVLARNSMYQWAFYRLEVS